MPRPFFRVSKRAWLAGDTWSRVGTLRGVISFLQDKEDKEDKEVKE
jgi:hypothetical protein